jgi:transcription termination factor Rho
MSQNKRYRRKKGFKKNRRQKGSANATASIVDEVRIEYSELPRDLSAEEIETLVDNLEKAKPKRKPKEQSHTDLQALPHFELHELAEADKLELAANINRRELIFRISEGRLLRHIPITVIGCLEIGEKGHAFLRCPENSYLADFADPTVPASLIERYGMKTGMTVEGRIRIPADGERYFSVHEIDKIDLHDPEEAATRTPFKELIPLYADERIHLEGSRENTLEMRITDLVTPVGRGQRGLIVAPPRTGKTVLLQQIAQSILDNAKDTHLIVLLIDERPEEVTDFERCLEGRDYEVVSSTFDEPSSRHMKVAAMVGHKARCLVEAGENVVVLLDSITRLARASNNESPSNGKLLSGGLEATALQFPKQFFGSARNIEDGGSLTILGTALIETGSKMDEVIFEEFKGTGNMELVLERRLADRRIFPALDINRSGTRKEELLFEEEEMRRVWMLRKVLNELDPVEAMEMLIQKMRRKASNGEFLLTIGS